LNSILIASLIPSLSELLEIQTMTVQTAFIHRQNRIGRLAGFVYGLVCYAIFFATICYTVGFVGNILVPHSIDSTPVLPLPNALLVDAGLLALFAIQHSIMARQSFKRWWTQFVPTPLERSTYVLASSLCLIALFYCWQPLGGHIWTVTNATAVALLYTIFATGWLILFGSTFLINHFDLFGLRQVWFYLHGEDYGPVKFATPMLYKVVRHPLYVGMLLGFWATPVMTTTHLLFALLSTGYILIGIRLEEKDLVQAHGESYRQYRRQVPMLIPSLRRRHQG
jgi:protein-S-isoprenylcysteine O-methyltransferase Ste14